MNGQPLLSNITHEPHGPVSGWTWPSGLAHVRAHGLDGEVQRIESAVAATYGYDPAGQLNQIHLWSQLAPPQADTVNSYGYDAAGRLSQANTLAQLSTGPAAASQAYAYDANGNRTSLIQNWSQAAYAYSANRLTQLSGTFSQGYQYDGAGRLSSDGFFGYAYDALGRLASVSGRIGAVASYRHNALGQRVAKDTFAGNTRFVYDEGGHLLGEYDAQGKPIQELVWLDDLPVATMRPKSSGAGTNVYYIHPDHLGTPRQITDSTSRIVWRWNNNDPFGANYPDEDADGDGIRFEFNLRFPGQYNDYETGKYYNYFRDYDPATGRYIQFDPIGLAGGINGFIYANQNPLSYTDPLGLKTYRCTKPLNALTDKFGSGVSKWAHDHVPDAYHQYSCVVDSKGEITCGGQDRGDDGKGKPSNDSKGAGQCKQTEPDNKCFEQCLIAEWGKPRPAYGIPIGMDCQEYDDDINQRCRNQCKK